MPKEEAKQAEVSKGGWGERKRRVGSQKPEPGLEQGEGFLRKKG